MAVSIIGPKFYAWDVNGAPLAGGKVYTYEAGTSTPKAAYTTETGDVAHSFPIVLNSEGYADIHLSGSYRIVLDDSADVLQWSADPVTSADQLSNEWIRELPATYISANSFSLVGNQSVFYEVGRAVRVHQTSGYVRGFITSSAYAGGITTIVADLDASLDASVDLAWVSVISEEALGGASPQSVASAGTFLAFDNVAEMKAATLESGDRVLLSRFHDGGDLVSDLEYYVQTNAEYGDTPDGFVDHYVSSLTHVAVLKHNGRFNAQCTGAKFDNATDDEPALNALYTHLRIKIGLGTIQSGTIIYPPGRAVCGASLLPPERTHHHFNGRTIFKCTGAATNFTRCQDETFTPYSLNGDALYVLFDVNDAHNSTFTGQLYISGEQTAGMVGMAASNNPGQGFMDNGSIQRMTIIGCRVGLLGQLNNPAFTGTHFGQIYLQDNEEDIVHVGNSLDDAYASVVRVGACDRLTAPYGGAIHAISSIKGFSMGRVFLRPVNSTFGKYKDGIFLDGSGQSVNIQSLFMEGEFNQPIRAANGCNIRIVDLSTSLNFTAQADAEAETSVVLHEATTGLIDVGISTRPAGTTVDCIVKLRNTAVAAYNRNVRITAAYSPDGGGVPEMVLFGGSNPSDGDLVEVLAYGRKLRYYSTTGTTTRRHIMKPGGQDGVTITIAQPVTFNPNITDNSTYRHSNVTNLVNSSGSNRGVSFAAPTIEDLGTEHTLMMNAVANTINVIHGKTTDYFVSLSGANRSVTTGNLGSLTVKCVSDGTNLFWIEQSFLASL